MSTFAVKPNALRTYAGTISGAGGSVGASGVNLAHVYVNEPQEFVESYVKVDTSSGLSDLFKLILSSNHTLVGHLRTTYDGIQPKLAQTGVALAISADDYQTTDESVNEKMDSVWKGAGKATPLDDEAGGGEVADPSEALEEVPESETEIPDPVHWVMDTAGWLSVGADVLKIADVFGVNPATLLTKAVAGDYGLVARAGNACKELAEFERATASSIAAGSATLAKSWTGNAATAAASYFHTWSNAFDAHASQLDDVSNKYAQLAQACAEVATELSSLLAFLIDKLLACAASLAAAGCLQEVPVVDVIIDIIGAYEVFTTKKAVEAFVHACTAVTDISEAVIGLATGIAGACAPGTADTDFPAAAYANGAQG